MARIEIDDKSFEAENGKMIIEVADEVGIYIPRFCYHKKLTVAANCRMCLVQIKDSKKTVPACATPISDGMKIYTKSEETVRSQQAVMEFLLINHPLDCPICDQGGECELQDISMGFGRSYSVYDESKRAVKDENLGPLIATEMTRCIHCTRCVRFGEEVAGLKELGATGRGEKMQISTYVNHSMTSEVSGNIIDLCPVGALTSKPYRFSARAWEMIQHPSIAPHDCIGSNIYLHTLDKELMRAIPRENETLNEIWLSDRDRFSYEGLKHDSRATQPMIKQNGHWQTVDWPTALNFTVEGISRIIKQHGSEQFAAFASPSATLEELYLLQKLMRELEINNLDHRLQQTDFRDQANFPLMPTNSLLYKDIENQENILLIGSNIQREVPLASLKIRKAQKNGAKIFALNLVDYDYNFNVHEKIITTPQDLLLQLANIVVAAMGDVKNQDTQIQKLLIGLNPDAKTNAIAAALKNNKSVIISGLICENHPDAALIRTLISLLTQHTGCKHMQLTTGSNSCGAWLAGMIPHRAAAGKEVKISGLDVKSSIENKLKGYFLLGVEPAFDFANPYLVRQSMLAAEFVVALSAFNSESLKDYADVILPIAPFAETSGTYINLDHTWQTVNAALPAIGEARPAWKVLRVLANLFKCPGFEYVSSSEVLSEIKEQNNFIREYHPFYPDSLPEIKQKLVRVGEWPLYRSDAIVRRSMPLQYCAAADTPIIKINPATAKKFNLKDSATISQANIEITLPLLCDERIPEDVVWVPNALPETIDLGHSFAEITIKP